MNEHTHDHDTPPSRLLLALETRALWEFGAYWATAPLLRRAPRGDGHPVLVLPGLAAGDLSTAPLRRYLASIGYDAHGWGLGRNLGPRDGVRERMHQALLRLRARTGRKVSVVGWSLGGVFARELARQEPDAVRQVITLGSPVRGRPTATNAWRLYEMASGRSAHEHGHRHSEPPPVPCTSIYSRTDGIVAWQCSLEPEGPLTDNVEVPGSHCGLGHNPAALYVIADRLALPEDGWTHFDRRGLRGMLFRHPRPVQQHA